MHNNLSQLLSMEFELKRKCGESSSIVKSGHVPSQIPQTRWPACYCCNEQEISTV